MQMRRSIAAQLGLRNQGLVEFGIAPLRSQPSLPSMPAPVQPAVSAAPVTPKGAVSPSGVDPADR